MAALLHPRPYALHDRRAVAPPVARFFALDAEPEPWSALPSDRPVLRIIPGGREAALRHRQPAHVYRLRRVGVLGGALAVLVAASVVLASVLAPAPQAAGPAAAPTAAAASAPLPAATLTVAADGTYRVRPGDTLWSIALALDPDGDVRPLVDALADRAGPGALQAGTTLDLSGLVESSSAR